MEQLQTLNKSYLEVIENHSGEKVEQVVPETHWEKLGWDYLHTEAYEVHGLPPDHTVLVVTENHKYLVVFHWRCPSSSEPNEFFVYHNQWDSNTEVGWFEVTRHRWE